MASIIQAFGWVVATATALYCVRTGRIQQHREWMIRSYPFAMVFVVVRTIIAIPAVDRMGLLGVETTVWSVIATACFLPSFILAWQGLRVNRPATKGRVPTPDSPTRGENYERHDDRELSSSRREG
jgi:uncharacterized membrane protein YozB (DUF420 family)